MNMRNSEHKICEDALSHYGIDAQILKTVEELNELAVELMHRLDGKSSDDKIKGELADVSIMIEQMCILFDGVDIPIAIKLYHLKKRIERDNLRTLGNKWGDVL